MNRVEIGELVQAAKWPEEEQAEKLVETHISWLILTPRHVYKIKKPVTFSFLDFNSAELRQYYCEEEVRLNKRLAPSMYLGVVGLVKVNDQWQVIEDLSEAEEYAVHMRRMPGEQQMDRLLREGWVQKWHIDQLAIRISTFHRNCAPEWSPAPYEVMQRDFNDIEQVLPWLQDHMPEAVELLQTGVRKSNRLLEKYHDHLKERHQEGWTRDVHGDMHSGNIFLLEQPLIFDCIEFSKALRTVDVLADLAYLYMDLMLYNELKLADRLLTVYQVHIPALRNQKDHTLFKYYALYRANVRIKVHALKLQQDDVKPDLSKLQHVLGPYLRVFKSLLNVVS